MYHPISREGMIEVDRIMVEELGIPVELMMEHASLNLAKVCVENAEKYKLINYMVVAGSGNNGGGGIVCARKLHGWGKRVKLWLPKGEPTRDVPIGQLTRAKACGVEVVVEMPALENTLVIDAFIGYNLHGELGADARMVIDAMKVGKVVSLDVPSGVDSNNGRNEGGLQPVAIVTLAWPKEGLFKLDDRSLGELHLVDIGVPGWVYQRNDVLEEKKQPTVNGLELVGNVFAGVSVRKIKLDHASKQWKF